jgi:rRNA maturation RNase YbeY
VVFVDSHYCTSINRRYLNHNYSTDVLAFVLEKAPMLEGEIYVNLDRAKEQASEYRVSFANEVARLVIHGTLHLIGYDDRTATAHKKMKTIENKHVRHWFPGKQRKSP